MKLKVVGKYVNRDKAYKVGDEIDVTDEEGAFLLNDAPGCFEEVAQVEEPVVEEVVPEEADAEEESGKSRRKAPKGPAADKMVDEKDGEKK